MRLKREDYTVAWLCALAESELVAATVMLDQEHETLRLDNPQDENTYTYGSINGHNVVIACLPPGQPGKLSVLRLVKPLNQSFPNLRIHLLVGIGGGVPRDPPSEDPKRDIHLGDVVVGWAEKTGDPGVVQWDYVRDYSSGQVKLLGTLDKPDHRLIGALNPVLRDRVLGRNPFHRHLERLSENKDFTYPGPDHDQVFVPNYEHVDDGSESQSCTNCEKQYLVKRNPRETLDPMFHQGTIASGDSVMMNAAHRDQISQRHNAICFEMEAAGGTDETHCLVIRGISDYADSHKNPLWQKYAAATAASFARQILFIIQPYVIAREKRPETLRSMSERDILNHLAPEGEAADTKEGFEYGHWQRSSGEWMKKSREYQSWSETKGGLLWCSGVAGAGKTVLANIMCDDLKTRYAPDADIQVIKIFFDYHYKRTREHCLASLWRQLASRRPFNDDEITILKRMYVEQRTRPDETKWKEMLAAEVRRCSRVFLIADALDEAKVEYPLQFVRELIGLLPTANIMITTRPHFKIQDLDIASEVSTIEVKAHEEDLLEFVKTRIDREENLSQVVEMEPELGNDLKEKVPKNAKGMFLLAQLHMADLAACSKPAQVRIRLEKPPGNLDDAYDASFRRIKSSYGKEVLYILCIAKTPITFAQMRCILSLEVDSESLNPCDYIVDKMVVGSSAGLVVHDQESEVVRFGHETTREYVNNFHSADIEKARLVLLRKCLAYLRFPSMRLEYWSENHQIQQHVNENPFLEYAAVFWGDHAREVGINDDKNLVVEDIMDLLSKPESLARAIRVFLWKTTSVLIEQHKWGGWGAEQKTKGKMRSINIVAYYGLDDILARLLQGKPEAYLHSSDPFGNVVHWAARGNHECVLNRLMRQPRIEEIINQNSELAHTPLHVALVFQRTRALEILLQNGADPSIKIHREPDWHSLELATRYGPPKHVTMLLDTNKTEQLLWTRDILGRLALNSAAHTDDTRSISVLLPLYAKAIEINHSIEKLRDSMGRNILHQAAQSDRPHATEVVLQHNLGQELARRMNYRGHKPFETAAFCGRTNVVKSYYDLVDREWLMGQLEAPLLAAYRGHSETLHELLNFFSCIPDAQDLYKRALIFTVENGRIESTKDVTRRITFTADDEILPCTLFLAARRGHVEVISHLLEKGAPINSQDSQGCTALHLAVSEGMAAGVRALLEAHCVLEIKDKRARTPLMIALEQRYPAISMLLLQYGALVPLIDGKCDLWLHTQSWWSRFHKLQSENPTFYEAQRPSREVMILDRKGALSPASSIEVFRAALYLHKALGFRQRTLPLVNWILELAEYWISNQSQRDGEHWYDENDPDPVYLRSLPIVGRESRPVQRITFQVSSHDQSDPSHGSSPGDFSGYTWVCIEREAAELRSNQIRILKNKTNRSDWSEFNISWPDRDGFDHTPDTPDEGEKEKWLASLGQGDRVLVVPKAILQNWRNFVNRAEMTVYTTCLRKTVYRRVSPKTGRLQTIGFASSDGQ